MHRILQINLNHCRGAQDLLFQTVSERKADLVIVSEPYKVPNRTDWVSSLTGTAAIYAVTTGSIAEIERSQGFVAVRWNGIIVYSCYVSPNVPFNMFSSFLNRLTVSISQKRGTPIIVAGDFNSASYSWNGVKTDRRGRLLESAMDQLGLILENDGYEQTFHRRGTGSVIDLTFSTPDVSSRVAY